MASPLLHALLPLCLLLSLSLARASAANQLAVRLADETAAMSIYDDFDGVEPEEDDDESVYVLDSASASDRRSLFWRRMRYYISYGALSANRVPCPPRSGRSYYTHSCWRARGPVRPYFRGCSTITRCRR